MSDCCYCHCWTLHYLYKKEQMGLAMERSYWFLVSLISSLFWSEAKQRDRRSTVCEKVSLWIRIVKHWAPGWGAAWKITAGVAALQAWCAKGLSLQMFSWHVTAGKLPALNETPELLNSCRLSARDILALPKISFKSFLCSRSYGRYVMWPISIGSRDENISFTFKWKHNAERLCLNSVGV